MKTDTHTAIRHTPACAITRDGSFTCTCTTSDTATAAAEYLPLFHRLSWHDGVTAEMNGEGGACDERGAELALCWNSHADLLAIAQSLADEDADGLGRSQWRLEAVRAVLARVNAPEPASASR